MADGDNDKKGDRSRSDPWRPVHRTQTTPLLLLLLVLALSSHFPAITNARASSEANQQAGQLEQIEVVFGSQCEKMLIREIDQAELEILIAIYSMTRRSIRDALVRAAGRAVKVRIKYDAKSSEWRGMKQAIGYMKKRGVKCVRVSMKRKYAKMHHKFTVIDRKRVLTGSYNYTTTASTANYENLVLIVSVKVATAFAKEFEHIKKR